MKKVLPEVIFCLFIGFIMGYTTCLYHESKLNTYYESKAEQELKELEKEFNNSLEKPHEFHIFNHQFCVWPVKSIKPRFHYKKIEIVGAGDDTKQTR
ncbi:MAG: hypothetical protein ACOYWZ_22380 [Bacillota bacterium]